MGRRAAVAAVITVSVLVALLNLLGAVRNFVPHRYDGMSYGLRVGRVTLVYPAENAARAGVVAGDHVLDLPRGYVWEGFRILFHPSSPVHVRTSHGVVAVKPGLALEPIGSALAATFVELTEVLLIGFAAALFARRPGAMSFALWTFAVVRFFASDLRNTVDGLPEAIGLPMYMAFAASQVATIPLIPFALRFPDGRLDPRARWVEIAGWGAFIACAVFYTLNRGLVLAGIWGESVASGVVMEIPIVVLPIVAGILLWRYVHSSAAERAQTAWAIVGFVGSILAVGLARAADTVLQLETISVVPVTMSTYGSIVPIEDRFFWGLANLFPLLAIYPILRYRLFDLNFIVNRAALYSILTAAAVATLAGVNWLAQHFVTERLALVVQPIAAIVIGLGYLRVRESTQRVLERLFFHQRFVAERELDATIRGFALAKRPQVIDESLTDEAAAILALQSAAVFRLRGERLERTASVGWGDGTLTSIEADDRLVRRLLTDDPVVRLSSLHWKPDGLPKSCEPVVAIALAQAGRLIGVAFYGRHLNATEIDPEEMALLRRLCAGATAAYETAEMRAEVAELRAQTAELRTEVASLKAQPV